MGNHFHLLVRMLPETGFTDEDMRQRFANYAGNSDMVPTDEDIARYRDMGTLMKLRDSISLKGNFGDVMLCNGWAIGVKAVWIVCSRKSVILI